MNPRRTTNRKMFWRILCRLFFANPGRLFVILLALGSGAAITTALLNLRVDANRRLTSEFRIFGANVIITPRDTGTSGADTTLVNQSILQRIPSEFEGHSVVATPFLYLVADATSDFSSEGKPVHLVVAGTIIHDLSLVGPAWKFDKLLPARGSAPSFYVPSGTGCIVGVRAANELGHVLALPVTIRNGAQSEPCQVVGVLSSGGTEDSQIFIDLAAAQHLAALSSRISLVQVSVDGGPTVIERFVASLRQEIPDVDVRPIRQFTEAQAKIYSRISGLLNFTVALVLVLTGLCVMAAMTNVAMERRTDVGLMKAIGGSVRRVLRFFLAEAALLGLVGGVLGATAGILLSIGLGKAVFGVAARPRMIVYPVAVALTILVAIVSSYPLRRLASIRPAAVFRGEA
jgi:putative ABC transport system permease protein